jgi:hypothetical protein
VIQRYRYSTHFPVHYCTRVPGFTSRILATDLSQPHCHFNSHMKFSWHSLVPFLPFISNHLRLPSPELNRIQFLISWRAGVPKFDSSLPTTFLHFIPSESESESYVTTDGQPASLSWYKAPIWCLRPELYYCLTVAGFLDLGRPL